MQVRTVGGKCGYAGRVPLPPGFAKCGGGRRVDESAAGMKAGTGGNGFDQWTVFQKYWITASDELDRVQLFEKFE